MISTESATTTLSNWIPYKLVIEHDDLFCQWLFVGAQSFTKPFFEETIIACKSHPFNSGPYRSLSSLESLIEWAKSFPEIVPSAVIFHVSRCGSTLLSQLIGLDKNYVVLAEVPFFDELLRLHFKRHNTPRSFQKEVLHASLKLIGQNRNSPSHKLIIKTDSWHIFFQDIYRELYPSVPFVLLYRSPDQVLASHQKQRGIQAVPYLLEPELLGFSKEQLKHLSLDEYTSTVLEVYLQRFLILNTADKNSFLLNYNQGVQTMMQQLEIFMKLKWTEMHVQEIEQRSQFHSKRPENTFVADTLQAFIPAYLNEAMTAYEVLEKKRSRN